MILEYLESILLASNRIQNPIYLFLRRFVNYKKLIKRSCNCDSIKDFYISKHGNEDKSEPKVLLMSFVNEKGNNKYWDLILLDDNYKYINSIRINSGEYNMANYNINNIYYAVL